MKELDCIYCETPLVGKQTMYCSDECLRKVALLNAKNKRAKLKSEQIESFKSNEHVRSKQQRAALMNEFRRGEKLSHNQKMAAWQTLDEYRELFPEGASNE